MQQSKGFLRKGYVLIEEINLWIETSVKIGL